MDWFQAILCILLLIVLAYWIYGRFISSDQRRGEETPQVQKDALPTREEAPVRSESPEKKPEAIVKAVVPPVEKKVMPAERPGLKEIAAQEGQVTYPVDFNYQPQRGEARFLHDPESGARIWVSGGLPQDHLFYRGGIRNGLAHGEGEAVLLVGRRDHSPRRIQGQFRDGIFMGNDPFPNRIIALLPGDFLIQIPCSQGDDVELWIHRGSLSDEIQLGLRQKGYPPSVLVVASPGLSAVEEDAVRDLMKRAFDCYGRSCDPVREVRVEVVPRAHVRKKEYNQTVFEPLMAQAQVSRGPGGELGFYNYQNPEAKAAEQSRKAEQREESRKRQEEMSPLRGRPDVRGARLGMRIEEVWQVLEPEVAEWEGPRSTPGEDDRYFRPALKIRLRDGATIQAQFTSRVSGSQLFLIIYEQYYSEGVPYKEVIQKLEQKYGKPDDLHKISSGSQWATYGLVSAVKPPNKAYGPGGAFFKTHVTPRYNSDFAEKLDIAFNDATLGYHDEAAIHEDQKAAARRKFEESKSDKVKF